MPEQFQQLIVGEAQRQSAHRLDKEELWRSQKLVARAASAQREQCGRAQTGMAKGRQSRFDER